MIVGGGGYIGRRLGAALRREGAAVQELSSRDGTGIDPDTGVFAAPPEVPRGVNAVVYLAQSPHHRQAPEKAAHLLSVNVVSAVAVAAAAAESGARKFLYASTGNIYSPAFTALAESSPLRRDNWYALSKIHAEEALALFRDRMDVTVARLFGVYGPAQTQRLVPDLVETVASGRSVILEPRSGEGADTGGLRISLCYVDDIVHILRSLLDASGVPVVNVADKKALSVRDIASAIALRLGVEPRFALSQQRRAFDLIANVSRLKSLLAPRFVPFAEGIARTLQDRPAAASPARDR